MAREFDGSAQARPLRVAFIVSRDDVHIDTILAGIFADCYARWGGRFSLIVPYDEDQISAGYWRWLEAYDPDILYSYVELKRDVVLEIHARLNPSQLGIHRRSGDARTDLWGFKPKYDAPPLSSLSMIYWLARFRGAQPKLKILDSWISEQASETFSDNFGAYHFTQSSTMFPADARGAADLSTIVSLSNANSLPLNFETVASEKEAITQYVNHTAV